MRTRSGRALHLIDIENLLGLPRPELADVTACRAAYLPIVAATDLVVVACNHGAFRAVGWGWPDARHIPRSGPDGADTALLDVIRHERVEHRFNTVVVASGDGIFTEAVAWLGGLGIAVTVVSREEALSRHLRMAAHNVRYLLPYASSELAIGEPA